ncbi:ATP-grasp domain-containing protein [Streptomyces sp. JW3]|uniref:ATP-grasp domain-containing protein n=1 Tax=Streptomyces sp. JW3 TaxID=3456955 RepID=UPI003FA47FC0
MSAEEKKNIFVVGLDEANLPTLQAVPGAESLEFHGLLTVGELQDGEVSLPEVIKKAERVLDAFDGSVDAIVGYWDFPVSTLVPILGERYGTRTTSLASIVKCEHKYWSRVEQRKVTDALPRFGRVDLAADPPPVPDGLRFPMWLKPALSYSSELAFGVKDEEEFRKAAAEIREGIARVGRPFEHILDQVDLPPEMDGVGGRVCLAEEALTGIQVAVEGYVHQGEVTVYGTLDSIDYPDSPCFLRHQYPSTLPPEMIAQLHDVTRRVMTRIGFEAATFSVEYFYDPKTQQVSLLEINPRHSQSHAELFQYVDGVPNHHAMLALALGTDPAMPHGRGDYAMAAKWYYRWFTDGVVRDVPSAEDIARIERELPGVRVHVIPEEGQLLSDLPQQDSYSYEVAHIFTGGADEEDLRRKFDSCVAALGLRIDEPGEGPRQ